LKSSLLQAHASPTLQYGPVQQVLAHMGKDFEAPVLCAVVDPTINKLATHLFESTQSVMCRCRCTVQHLANLNEGVLQVVVQLVNLVYH